MTSGITEHVLEVGDVRLVIDLESGGRLSRWWVGDQQLLVDHGPAPEERGMYVMAPWAGRLRENALVWQGQRHEFAPTYGGWAMHGLGVASPAAVISDVAEHEHAAVTVAVTPAEGWPWPLGIELTWDLTPRVLTTTISVHAADAQFPVTVGWHPWFARQLAGGAVIRWTAESTLLAERGQDYLPNGRLLPIAEVEGPFDDAFVVPSGRASVAWPGALSIDIVNDAPWFVIFDQLPDAVCVEPQSGPPNGINDALVDMIPTAAPGQPHRMVTTWTMRDALPEDQD